MNEGVRAIAAFAASAIGLAIIAVLMSSRANTAGVITAGGSALSSVIGAAVAPVTGSGGGSSPLSMLGSGSNPLSMLGGGDPLSMLGGGLFGGMA
jgi:hypothetical protein